MPRLPIYIWSFCQFIHLLNFPWWVDDLMWLGLITWVSLMAVWVMNSRPLVVLSSALLVLALWSFRMPEMANHIQVELLISLLVVGWAVKKLINQHRSLDLGQLIRVGLPFIYLLAAFQKLNSEYLFSEHSYALFLANGILERLGIGSINSPALLAVATIIWEACIGLLLLSPKTRKWGLTIGVLFHLSMAIAGLGGVQDFSLMALLYYCLFLPESRQERITTAIEFVHWGLLVIGFLGLALCCWVLTRWGTWQIFVEVGIYAGGLWFLLMVFGKSKTSNWALRRSHGAGRWLFPLLLTFIALLPHFGHRTALAFDMFSNLRTEPGYENHLFMPSVHLWDYQEVILVTETNIPGLIGDQSTPLQGRAARMTRHGVKQYLNSILWSEQPRVIFETDEGIDSMIGVPELNVLERKLLVFDLVPISTGKVLSPQK